MGDTLRGEKYIIAQKSMKGKTLNPISHTLGSSDYDEDFWGDLVISLLAVNQYSLEKTYGLVEGLREQGLLAPRNLALWDQREILRRLKAAGCDRGAFMTSLFALRLANLGDFIEKQGVEACAKVLSGNDRTAIETLLLRVSGIGPKVVRNYCFLRESS